MQIQRVNRTNAEKIFIIAHNAEANSITTGMGAMYCNAVNAAAAAVSADGISVLRITGAASMYSFAGIAAQDIPSDGYGRVQAWGYCDSIIMSHRASNTTIGAGLVAETFLLPGGVAGTFTSTTAQDITLSSLTALGILSKTVQIFDTVVLSLSLHSAGAWVWGKGYVRAL